MSNWWCMFYLGKVSKNNCNHYLFDAAKQYLFFVLCRCVAEGPHKKSGRRKDDGNLRCHGFGHPRVNL